MFCWLIVEHIRTHATRTYFARRAPREDLERLVPAKISNDPEEGLVPADWRLVGVRPV